MHETWLKPNRRALAFGMVPPIVLAVLGGWMLCLEASGGRSAWFWIAMGMISIGIIACAMLVRQMMRPRIALGNGHVLFNLRRGQPIAVPVEIVEAFFLGQGPAALPAGLAGHEEAVNLVARLSQRHTEWSRQDVKPALGRWCDGYVTIRGTWCERLDGEVIRRINRRLKEVKTLHEGATESTTAGR